MGRSRTKCMPCVENTGAVVLALSALDPGHWIVPLVLAEMPPEAAFRVLRVCSGLLFPIHSMRGEQGIEAELREVVGAEKAEAVLALGDAQSVEFPPFEDLHRLVEMARCFTFSKALGEEEAAARLGLSRSTVHARRAYVCRKIQGG